MNSRLMMCATGWAVAGVGVVAQGATINFDASDNWAQGGGSMTSYQTDHVYSEGGWTFTGGPALRQGTADQDGVPGAMGAYAWRLRDADGTAWTATYNASGSIGSFGFDVRRWDGSPAPDWSVTYSTDGGATFSSSIQTIDNTFLGGTSAWETFNYQLPSMIDVDANDFVVRVSRNSGERIMIDNFSYTVPEPGSIGLIAVGGLLIMARRRQPA